MPIDPGQFRQRLTYQEPTISKDSVGQAVESFADVATVWAMVSPLNAREQYWASQVQASTTHTITCRYDARLKPTGRFLMDGSRVLNIDGIKDEDSRRVQLTISATEQIPSES